MPVKEKKVLCSEVTVSTRTVVLINDRLLMEAVRMYLDHVLVPSGKAPMPAKHSDIIINFKIDNECGDVSCAIITYEPTEVG